MISWYNKKYIFGLSRFSSRELLKTLSDGVIGTHSHIGSLIPVPDTECLNLKNFLGDRSIFYSSEVTLDGFLNGGDWTPERPSHGWKLETFSPALCSPGRRERLDIEL